MGRNPGRDTARALRPSAHPRLLRGGGANVRHVNWQPRKAEGCTKHLYAACGFESSSRGDMTAALCDVMYDYAQQGGNDVDDQEAPSDHGGPLAKTSVGSQPIFKQLLPMDPEQQITMPVFNRACFVS